MKRLISGLMGLLAILSCLTLPTGCGEGDTSAQVEQMPVATDVAEAPKAKTAAMPSILDFGSKRCPACLKLAPIIEELRNEYQGVLNVEFVDVAIKDNEARAQKYGVKMIPTLVFLDKDGKELTRNVGFASKEDILKKWRELGHDFSPAAAPEVE